MSTHKENPQAQHTADNGDFCSTKARTNMNTTIKFKITVTDSLGQDGVYFVEVEKQKSMRKTERTALWECIKRNKIKGSQSGTLYKIKLAKTEQR